MTGLLGKSASRVRRNEKGESDGYQKRTRTWDKTPEAQAYRNQYTAEHYDRVTLALPAGFRDRLDKAAGEAGISRTALIVKAIEAYLNKCE